MLILLNKNDWKHNIQHITSKQLMYIYDLNKLEINTKNIHLSIDVDD